VFALITCPRRDSPEEEGPGHDPDEGGRKDFHDRHAAPGDGPDASTTGLPG